MKILVLDNYDSFTYNLVHIIKELGFGGGMEVHRNDKIPLDQVDMYEKILLSPGPGLPGDAGILPELLKRYASAKSILGVCLGHQAIGEAFGAKLENMEDVLHGVATNTFIKEANDKLFMNIPSQIKTTRYHSWTIVPNTVPEELIVTAVDENEKIMAVSHKTYDVRGVQFHPESILTEYGIRMIENWLN